mmetsp:Transcript_5674/g.25196  ORF Transcript_5674/g.25196 Transcript_5674/m.25196 type:complete len:322 (+) Transcript_5674:1222-2187(+)
MLVLLGSLAGRVVPRMLRQQRFQPTLIARRHHPVVPSGTVPDGGTQEHEDKTGVRPKVVPEDWSDERDQKTCRGVQYHVPDARPDICRSIVVVPDPPTEDLIAAQRHVKHGIVAGSRRVGVPVVSTVRDEPSDVNNPPHRVHGHRGGDQLDVPQPRAVRGIQGHGKYARERRLVLSSVPSHGPHYHRRRYVNEQRSGVLDAVKDERVGQRRDGPTKRAVREAEASAEHVRRRGHGREPLFQTGDGPRREADGANDGVGKREPMAQVHEIQALVILELDAIGQVVEHHRLDHLPNPVVLHEASQAERAPSDVEQSGRERQRG